MGAKTGGSLFILSFFFFNISFSQNPDTISNDSINKGGDYFRDKAFSLYTVDLDSCIFYLEKSLPHYKKEGNSKEYTNNLNRCTGLYYSLEDYEQAEFYAILAKDFIKNQPNPNQLSFADALNNLSSIYSAKGNLVKAIETSEKALKIRLQNNSSQKIIAETYINLANYLSLSGDLDKALEYAQIATTSYQSQPKAEKNKLSKFYITQAYIFEQQNLLDSSIYYNNKVINELLDLSDIPQNKNTLIETYLNITKVYIKKQELKEAEASLKKAFNLQKEEKALRKALSYEQQGKIYLLQGEFSKAEKAARTSLNLIKKQSKNESVGISNKHLLLAEVLSKKGNWKIALDEYQNALLVLSYSKESYDPLQVPSVNQYISLNNVLRVLEAKANFLWNQYQKNNTIDFLNASSNTYQVACEVIQKMRQGFLSEESKNALSEKTIPVYEGAIKTSFELYNREKGESYKEKAFALAESNKAQLLLESLNDQTAKGFANIPDSLLKKEKTLRADIAFYEKSIIEKIQQKNNPEKLKELRSIVFNKKQLLDQLNNQFEKDYPRYFNLKYKNAPIAINKIQQSLKGTNKAFLEYFVGEENIYLFVITSESIDIQRIENEDLLSQNVEVLRNMLYHPPPSSFGEKEFNSFSKTANDLYHLLIHPATEKLAPNITDLVIIPDYYLNYIPFDILLIKPGDPKNGSLSDKSMDYLFEEFNISYDYSATLHLKNENRNARNFKSDFIGFAPSFNDTQELASRTCTASELYSLKCSDREIRQINEITDGEAYFGKDANRQSFELDVSSSKIIHLATHACIDDSNANFNKIFLSDDYLSNFDLYNMELNAELAVLSACNTGSGKLIKGEGVMSLARGFINAGCSSTVMSMWSVDDCATSDIMIYFYEGLKEGLTKDKALKAAKIKYLNSVDKSKMHPYYWAAFVPFGDMEAIEVGGNSNWLFYLFSIGLLFFSLFLVLYSKAKKASKNN